MLGPRDPLPQAPHRILVAGVTGAGKSTLARRIAGIRDIRYIEIDSLYHGPNWTKLGTFLSDVDTLTAEATWITEWQYQTARPILADRADTVVWLDYPAWVSLGRLVRRTLRRRWNREVLWNGNIEPPLWHFFAGRDHIFLWALKTQRKYRTAVPELETTAPHLRIVRLRRPADAEVWLDHLATLPPG